jgi:type IV secretion system protein VirB2
MDSDFAPRHNVLDSAVLWLQGALSGQVATAIGVIAVASFGIALFFGRIELRRAVQLIVGCFLIFGASAIARGFIGATHGESGGQVDALSQTVAAAPQPTAANPSLDPYPGASLKQR